MGKARRDLNGLSNNLVIVVKEINRLRQHLNSLVAILLETGVISNEAVDNNKNQENVKDIELQSEEAGTDEDPIGLE